MQSSSFFFKGRTLYIVLKHSYLRGSASKEFFEGSVSKELIEGQRS